MSEFLTDPSILTKDKLKSALVANNVALPNGDQRKGVYVELYLKNLTSQNKKSSPPDAFSSDEELDSMISNKSRSGRKATRKTDRLSPEELDVTDLTDEGLREQLLKYGICVGPIVASTRKVYEKRLQKFLEQGLSDVTPPHPDDHAHSSPLHLDHTHSSPPHLDHAHSVLLHSEHAQTDSSHNGTTYTDQYSDTEGEMTAVPDPEPVPVVERPVRSRGKQSVTPRTLSSQHRVQEEEEVPEEELQVWAVRRKSRRTPRSLDQTVPASDDSDFSELSAAEGLSAPRKRTTLTPVAAPRDPTCLLADKPPELSWSESPGRGVVPGLHAVDGLRKAFLTEELYEKSRLPEKSGSPQHKAPWQRSSKERAGCRGAQSGRRQDDIGSLLSPVPHVHGQGCSSEEQDSGVRIEKLSYVEQTPKMAERNVLKEMFPNESLSTPTSISVSCRPPIKGAAGRPLPDAWLNDLRPRLTELRQTSASYTESRSAPPMAATPFTASRATAPPVVQATARRAYQCGCGCCF